MVVIFKFSYGAVSVTEGQCLPIMHLLLMAGDEFTKPEGFYFVAICVPSDRTG